MKSRMANRALRMDRRAFTLIEMAMAMGMTAMLALSLYMSLNIAVRAQRSATQSVEPTRAASIAAEIVKQDLESALPPTGVLAGPFIGTRLGDIGAEADALEFHCIGGDGAWEDRAISEGVRRVELSLRTDVDPPLLVRRVTRNLLAPVVEAPEEEVLCRGVRSFALRYFDGTTWQDQWDSTTLDNVLPLLVELTLRMQPAAGQVRGTEIVRVVPLACATTAAQTGGAP